MDSTTVTVTAPVKSLEASLILGSWQDGRKSTRGQGCQMVHFQTKNRNLGKFWSVLQLKICIKYLVYFTAVFYIL
jgi:hypothetical protein